MAVFKLKKFRSDKKQQDSWCESIIHKGKKLSGGAARNVRISQSGGMDKILEEVARDAANQAWNRAQNAINESNQQYSEKVG